MAIKGRQAPGQMGLALIVRDVAAAADFYRDALGAEEIGRSFSLSPSDPPGDRPFNAEFWLRGTYLVVTQENPNWQKAPRPDWPRSPLSAGAASAFVMLYVDDVDAVFARALAAGATIATPSAAPQDAYWGDRVAQFHDPFGHVWRLLTSREEVGVADLPARCAAEREAWRAAKVAARG